MKSKIYRIEIPESKSELLTRLHQLLAQYALPVELVAHRDDDDTVFECAPPPEGYHVEVFQCEYTEYFAVPNGTSLRGDTQPDHVWRWKPRVWQRMGIQECVGLVCREADERLEQRVGLILGEADENGEVQLPWEPNFSDPHGRY